MLIRHEHNQYQIKAEDLPFSKDTKRYCRPNTIGVIDNLGSKAVSDEMGHSINYKTPKFRKLTQMQMIFIDNKEN